jgi:integrase
MAGALVLRRELVMSSGSMVLVDAAGRRRSPATIPGYLAGRAPHNKGMQYPPDPPRPEEIVVVMRQAGHDRHGLRLRALIAVLWRGGLRISEALALAETDIDERRGSLLIRHGKGDKRREAGMDQFGFEQLAAWLAHRVSLPVGRCSASSTVPPADDDGPLPRPGQNYARLRPTLASGAGSRPTNYATRTPSSSPARAWP